MQPDRCCWDAHPWQSDLNREVVSFREEMGITGIA